MTEDKNQNTHPHVIALNTSSRQQVIEAMRTLAETNGSYNLEHNHVITAAAYSELNKSTILKS